jgi:hypothetical protein
MKKLTILFIMMATQMVQAQDLEQQLEKQLNRIESQVSSQYGLTSRGSVCRVFRQDESENKFIHIQVGEREESFQINSSELSDLNKSKKSMLAYIGGCDYSYALEIKENKAGNKIKFSITREIRGEEHTLSCILNKN